MLTDSEIQKIRRALDEAQRPLFFFDDDPDGLASFLLLYRRNKEGSGVVIKSAPEVGPMFLRKVEEFQPDIIFVLDKPKLSDEFIEGIKVPIYWIDHHELQNPHQSNVHYFNPKKHTEENFPTSSLAYQVVEEDLWIAAVGTIGDWCLPYFLAEIKETYPKLIDNKAKTAQDFLFTTKLGTLARIFSFILKGNTSDAKKYINTLTRIQEPEEILEGTSSQGKYVYKKFKNINQEYESLLSAALDQTDNDPIVFKYTEDKTSFTSDLSNELVYRFPQKTIIIARLKGGEYKCSIRNTAKPILPVVQKALIGVQGYGGGHENACGACIKEEDFDRFLEPF